MNVGIKILWTIAILIAALVLIFILDMNGIAYGKTIGILIGVVGIAGVWRFIKIEEQEHYDDTDSFSEGHAKVRLNDKWGYIDKTGKEVTPLKYDTAYDFSGGLACVKLDDQYGFIDKTGKEVIPLRYDDVCSFFGFKTRIAIVNLGGRWIRIDSQGNYRGFA